MRLDDIPPQTDHLRAIIHEGARARKDGTRRGAADLKSRLLEHPKAASRIRSTCSALKISSGGQRFASRGNGASERPLSAGRGHRSAASAGGGRCLNFGQVLAS